ncbi:putative phosphatidylinositol 4-phosphate 5-kinase MSS4 [Phytophthora ramorum]|uniref:putative phosphatidylinositol 4-phosphate 5-kinase MSS4 n=1 Tax=Phytophthora ramorum TaxID=164328 RepID=UPI0030ABB33E|nr:putative phosphatidylinositol 4-phosphate 5-kinase MSS4 [Phytophthora ramorum]
MERSRGGSPDEFTVSIPSDLLLTEPRPQESSIESSVVATDCEDEKPPDPVVSRVEDPRYACVIAIGSADIFGSTVGSKSPGSGLKKRGSTGSPCPEDAVEEVVCQCVAVDFLPTPAKLSRTPVIVKKLNFTATNVSTSQEIFSTGGECVICLERPLATIQLPCRFFCVCYECLEEIDQCPHLPSQSAQLYLLVGLLGVVVYLLLVLSYFLVPNIKAQHPAADLVVWHAGCGFMTSAGFVFAFALQRQDVDTALVQWQCSLLAPYNQFFFLAGACWYLMLTLDLLVALVNPWMGYSCKSWAYHTIVWSVSAVSALLLHQLKLFGLSPLNVCWVKRTRDPMQVNTANWVFLFAVVAAICVLSFAVLLFASFRFVRRQLDVTYRAKRRNLMQYYRYLLIFAGHWAACGALYYAAYRQHFDGKMAKHFELAFALVFGSYPVLLLIVWVLNTELYQNFSSENNLSKSERGAGDATSTEHFSAALRKDLMRYTTAGIRCSISESPADSLRSPLLSLTRDRFGSLDRSAALSFLQMEEGGSAGLYHEKKRLATTVYNGEYRYYEKLGFTDYAPKVFQNIREICGIDNEMYEQSFADTLLERASEGKSGMLFYFTSDRKYLVKTMTKKEHSFLLEVLPLFHQYILKQPNSLLCRFLGCHSMQLPVGWNKMFFVVMENIFPDGPVDERYDLKGIFHQSNFRYQEGVPTPVSSDWSRSGREEEGVLRIHDDDEAASSDSQSVDSELGHVTEKQPLLRRGSSRPSLRYDNDFVTQRASLRVNPTTRANLLAQVTSDCGFLQELGIMDYSCLLGIRHYNHRIEPEVMDNLAHNAVVAADQSTVYYLGFVDILQHYNIGWKMQHCLLAAVVDKRQITALPPAEYALRFLNFIHEYLLRDPEGSHVRSYGSIGYSPSSFVR